MTSSKGRSALPGNGGAYAGAKRSGWEWIAEVGSPEGIVLRHLIDAYGLTVPPCGEGGTHGRSCKDNPNCLRGLGEKGKRAEVDIACLGVDPALNRRPENGLVGLKNFGATCYMNSLLQVWFNNAALRSAILEYKSDEKDVASSVPLQLQRTFSYLGGSLRRCFAPASLCRALGIRDSEQQDAQEFSKLLLCLLESSIDSEKLSHSELSGTMAYVTKCKACNFRSKNDSKYYELEIPIAGKDLLTDAIRDHFKEETLCGDDMYHCPKCKERREAVRQSLLTSLPRTLTLQLMRFVFDREAMSKRKIGDPVRFPDTLDLSQCVPARSLNIPEEDRGRLYTLSGILIHRGPSAYSGHYIAHVRSSWDGNWYRFDDEAVVRIPESAVGIEDDGEFLSDLLELEGRKGGKKGNKRKLAKLPKGFHESSSAYALVYTLESYPPQPANSATSLATGMEVDGKKAGGSIVAPMFADDVASDNAALDREIIDYKEKKEELLKFVEDLRAAAKEAYDLATHCVSPQSNSDLDLGAEIVSRSWLEAWIKRIFGPLPVASLPICNDSITCVHGKVDPLKRAEFKSISAEAANRIRMIDNRVADFTAKHAYVQAANSSSATSSTVGVDSAMEAQAREDNPIPAKPESAVTTSRLDGPRHVLPDALCRECTGRVWEWKRRQASITCDIDTVRQLIAGVRAVELTEPPVWIGRTLISAFYAMGKSKATGALTTCSEASASTESKEHAHDAAATTEMEIDCDSVNDAQCSHGNLSIHEKSRVLIPAQAFAMIGRWIPNVAHLAEGSLPCAVCEGGAQTAGVNADRRRYAASEQKVVLADILSALSSTVTDAPCAKTICPARVLKNADGPCVVIAVDRGFADDLRRFVRSPGRYEVPQYPPPSALLCRHGLLPYDPLDTAEFASRFVSLTEPEFGLLADFYPAMAACRIQLTLSLTKPFGVLHVHTCTPAACADCTAERKTNEASAAASLDDGWIFVRRVKSKLAVSQPAPDTGNGGDGQGRRPQRMAGGVRKKVFVSAKTTVRELKLEVMSLFTVAPFDQHIFRNGVELCDNAATLVSLGVPNDETLDLYVDEAMGNDEAMDAMRVDDTGLQDQREEGFRGEYLMRDAASVDG